MPPLPPGVFEWGMGILFLILFIVGLIVLIRIATKTFPIFSSYNQTPNAFKEPINELIEEVRMLRREIEELKKELRE